MKTLVRDHFRHLASHKSSLGKSLASLGLGAVLLGVGAPAQAAHRLGAFSITPTASFINLSSKYNLKNTTFPGIQFGYDLSDRLSAKVNYGHLSARQTGSASSSVSGEYYSVNGDYYFRPGQQFEPFLTAGLGLLHFNPSGDDANDALNMNAGAGLEYFFEPNVSVSIEAADVYAFSDARYSALARFGVHVYLGAEPKCAAVA